MVAACRGVAEARRGSGREARFRASGGHSVRGEELDPMKKLMSGLAIAAIASTAFVGIASAQSDTANSGNGGVSSADSSGGGVSIGSTDTGSQNGSSTSIGGGNSGSTVLLEGAVPGEDLAATIIARILGQ
jgi:hypothetical protein